MSQTGAGRMIPRRSLVTAVPAERGPEQEGKYGNDEGEKAIPEHGQSKERPRHVCDEPVVEGDHDQEQGVTGRCCAGNVRQEPSTCRSLGTSFRDP